MAARAGSREARRFSAGSVRYANLFEPPPSIGVGSGGFCKPRILEAFMAHPTCAHARLPSPPPAGDHSPRSTDAERDVVAERVKAELHAANEAGLALTCLRKLIVHTQGLSRDERSFSHYEVECLMA